jgi:hypothetical protein
MRGSSEEPLVSVLLVLAPSHIEVLGGIFLSALIIQIVRSSTFSQFYIISISLFDPKQAVQETMLKFKTNTPIVTLDNNPVDQLSHKTIIVLDNYPITIVAMLFYALLGKDLTLSYLN